MSLQSHWNQLKNGRPGKRFENFYQTRQKDRCDGDTWRRVLYVTLGIALTLVGIIMLGMPGPGLLVVAFGLALVASEFLFMARLLDRAEVLIRGSVQALKQWWHNCLPYQRSLGVMAVVILLIGMVGCAYKLWV
ncbi:TIGR02611 family protein [Prosthecobacter debontii]|uniref:TIGR02611 family protein n=1 Tax=Prosthecobacter debontii TaxID=48467 RepID=A0A1T4WXN8_9BACT|nr:PGPGW domain-containing protein [Prosthecobacter debontii]SKA82143.1 TIGR02611 family protein [Prosthecobacter debontii]